MIYGAFQTSNELGAMETLDDYELLLNIAYLHLHDARAVERKAAVKDQRGKADTGMGVDVSTRAQPDAASTPPDLTGADAYTKLRRHWIESEKREKDWRNVGEVKLLEQMREAVQGLRACGWREIDYGPKDGTRFLAICAGSTKIHPHYYSGEWPKGSWWAEASGDLWPARPILWKPMPSNKEE
jgi:hypothetical protein